MKTGRNSRNYAKKQSRTGLNWQEMIMHSSFAHHSTVIEQPRRKSYNINPRRILDGNLSLESFEKVSEIGTHVPNVF